MQFQECDPDWSYDIPFHVEDMLMIRNVSTIPMRLYIPATLIGRTQFCTPVFSSNQLNFTFPIKIFQLFTIEYS